jgi:intracellular sulfur oxidation DsrE/DsrF family protein
MQKRAMPHSTAINPRRNFLGKLAAGAAALTFLGQPLRLSATPLPDIAPLHPNPADPDTWFGQLKGKHRMILDVPRPHEIFPFAWPRIFLMTNTATGTPEKETNVVVVLRHEGIPYAFEDRIWAKYKLGEFFKIDDPKTKAPAIRNPFWQPMPGDYAVPGIGNVDIGINQLQSSGVLFCVCDVAMTVYSAAVAEGIKGDPKEIKQEWMSALLPGIQPVPSGIWAVGRAQEHGCAYCFAG